MSLLCTLLSASATILNICFAKFFAFSLISALSIISFTSLRFLCSWWCSWLCSWLCSWCLCSGKITSKSVVEIAFTICFVILYWNSLSSFIDARAFSKMSLSAPKSSKAPTDMSPEIPELHSKYKFILFFPLD